MIIIIILYAKTVENIGKILGIRGMGKSPSNDVPKMKESLDGPIGFCGRTEGGMDGWILSPENEQNRFSPLLILDQLLANQLDRLGHQKG